MALINYDFFNPKYLLDNFGPSLVIPKRRVNSIADITQRELFEKRIYGIVFDVDHTLTYRNGALHPKVAKAFKNLTEFFDSCLLSNCSEKRTKQLEEMFDIPVVRSKRKKPHPEAFYDAVDLLNYPAERTAMIDDRVLTGIIGGNRIGMYTILVSPLSPEKDPPHIKFARLIEDTMLRFYTINAQHKTPAPVEEYLKKSELFYR